MPPFKAGTGWVDDFPMTFRPLSLILNQPTDPAPAPGHATLDYARYSDDQLIAERERRQRQRDELVLHTDGEATVYTLLVSIDGEVERITDELMRRARSRHPSSFNPAS
jgi:hypothetical protein